MAQRVKNPPAVQKTWVRCLDWRGSWRRERLPPPVFLPGESHGQRSLAGYHPRGRKESDRTEHLQFTSCHCRRWTGGEQEEEEEEGGQGGGPGRTSERRLNGGKAGLGTPWRMAEHQRRRVRGQRGAQPKHEVREVAGSNHRGASRQRLRTLQEKGSSKHECSGQISLPEESLRQPSLSFSLASSSEIIFFNDVYFSLEDNCFTMLCWFLPYQQHESAVRIHISPSCWS